MRGVEWVLRLYELAIVVVPVYGVVWLRRRVKRGTMKKLRAFWCYAGLVLIPVIVYTLFFLVLVGVEQISRISLITEELARSLAIVIGLGLSIWLISSVSFGFSLAFTKAEADGQQSSRR